MKISRLQKNLDKRFGTGLEVRLEDRTIIVSGELDSWDDIVEACSMCVVKDPDIHVVNDIKLKGVTLPETRIPDFEDEKLEGRKPDVLIIGGGISGASIARELTRWKLDILLVDKEADVAYHSSGRNDGEVHPGVDLSKGTLKQKYIVKGNRMFDQLCKDLQVPFNRCGQYVGFFDRKLYPAIKAYAIQRKHVCGIEDTRVIGKKELREAEPNLNKDYEFALYNPSAGSVCPYGLTIAYAENAVQNGAEISLNTAVLGMDVEDGVIKSVKTNRGTIYPKIVINAAGTFAEDIAKMAGDRFYSIHPRKGTNSIVDRKVGALVRSISSWKTLEKNTKHTKGGGIVHTVSDNLLVGPDAVETYMKEDFTTEQSSIDHVFSKQKDTAKDLSERDIITYFSGVRAATFEEDYVIEPGRKTENLIHVAGIQSSGLTTAPAVALDVEKMAIKMLRKQDHDFLPNSDFNPVRKAPPELKKMSPEERAKLIAENPDYGIIICRCEEISKGEILDAIRSPLPVPTVDGIKKRVRPGMGRCQGGFCSPLVTQIISEELGIPLEDVRKNNDRSVITFGPTKGGNHE